MHVLADKVPAITCHLDSNAKFFVLFSYSYYVRLPLNPGNVDRIENVPVLQAVLQDPAIKGVPELPLGRLEVSVTGEVGFLVGRHVVKHHLRLQRRKPLFNTLKVK